MDEATTLVDLLLNAAPLYLAVIALLAALGFLIYVFVKVILPGMNTAAEQIVAIRKTYDDIADREEKLAKREIEALQEDLAEEKAARAELEKQVKGLDHQLTLKIKDIDREREKVSTLRTEMDAVKKELETVKEDRDRWRERFDQVEKERDDERQKRRDLQEKFEVMQARIAGLEEKLKKYEESDEKSTKAAHSAGDDPVAGGMQRGNRDAKSDSKSRPDSK